jgi:hypothetical protein
MGAAASTCSRSAPTSITRPSDPRMGMTLGAGAASPGGEPGHRTVLPGRPAMGDPAALAKREKDQAAALVSQKILSISAM